jgi:DNA-binding NarL/FixJ family response regulator
VSVTERVLLIEPHFVCRQIVADLISRTKRHLHVVGQTSPGTDTHQMVSHTDPSVVLLFSGEDAGPSIAAVHLAAPGARIVVLSRRTDGEAVFEAIRAGAIGFLPETAEPEDVVEALDRASRDESTIDVGLVTAGIRFAAKEAEEAQSTILLTHREQEVLELLSEGMSSNAIAERLYLSRRTVESHLSSAYHKLGVRGRIEALGAFQTYRKRHPMRTSSAHRNDST